MADPYPTGVKIKVRVEPAFAAAYLTGQMDKQMKARPVARLSLGDEFLGFWQVESVATERTNAGYDVAMATLRQVFGDRSEFE